MANGQIKGVGDVGNDRANCYKRLKISLALGGVFAPRFAFMGRQAVTNEALENRLNRETGTLSGLITGVRRAFWV